ncbi:hypothetical protein E4T39_03030 [Aureobasidium subglaciale]|nr:hypothetical protein E4T39_03030 [Aureobasidium subglaciale]
MDAWKMRLGFSVYTNESSQMLDARRFRSDRTPNDPSACVERLRKDAPANGCNTARDCKGIDNAKHRAAGTNQHAAALVVDMSVVSFWLDPRVLVDDALRFLDLDGAGLGLQHARANQIDLQVGFHG